ncbi:MAG: hypothetical protein EOO96_02400 [Pedobacter sp.]|nr:MAG: hypothetical protein EOO96_02400 [Pedobacter sp.]
MLQRLSYINLIFAIIYLLVFLRSGTLNSTVGIFVIIVLNWLCIRSYQLDNYKWSYFHYPIALWVLYYGVKLLYGWQNIFFTTVEYDFVSNDTLTYLILTFLFSVLTLTHLVLYFLKSVRKES